MTTADLILQWCEENPWGVNDEAAFAAAMAHPHDSGRPLKADPDVQRRYEELKAVGL